MACLYSTYPDGKDYYFGDDYLNYPVGTTTHNALNLVKKYCSGGSLLDVGCAMGIYTSAFLTAGYDAFGADISEFAISEAKKLVGHEHARRCNFDIDEIPFDGPFDVIWFRDALEHSSKPFELLNKMNNRIVLSRCNVFHPQPEHDRNERNRNGHWVQTPLSIDLE